MSPHRSDSQVQRDAEQVIRERAGDELGISLRPKTLAFPTGARVDVDAVSEDESVLAEIFARQSKLKGGQQRKVTQDAFKLVTLARDRPGARLYLIFASQEAATYAVGRGWLADALKAWSVEVLVVDIPHDLRQQILAAERSQTMINPPDDAL